jgi:uncharacterized protein YndB with AHSA1/START domain
VRGPIVQRSRVIPAPPEAIFELLADPSAHPRFDGTGTVRASLFGPKRLSLGARFGMQMRIGLPYRITNTVVEFEEGRRIAWRHFGGHTWRYELEPVQGGTKVTETFDGTTARVPFVLRLMGVERTHPRAIEATLERLERLVGEAPQGRSATAAPSSAGGDHNDAPDRDEPQPSTSSADPPQPA